MTRSPMTKRIRPNLESLNDRIVPATLVDLTTHGSVGTSNGALFQQFDAPTGNASGIHTFLLMQSNGVEQGYNTDGKISGSERKDHFAGRAIRLSQVPIVRVDGVDYRVFALDISQRAGSPTLSLDELRIYVDKSRLLSGYSGTTKKLDGRSPVFDMDGGGDTAVKLNAALNPTNSRGDAFVYIPNSVFAGQSESNFVYLYSKFSGANGGIESWSVRPVPTPPASQGSTLSGSVFLDYNGDGLQQLADGEVGFEGIMMQLTGTDNLGNAVSLTTYTGKDGSYQFTNLPAGTYDIYKASEPTGLSPNGYNLMDGDNYPGSLSGTDQNFDPENSSLIDGIINISVGANQTGTNYNFAHLEDYAY